MDYSIVVGYTVLQQFFFADGTDVSMHGVMFRVAEFQKLGLSSALLGLALHYRRGRRSSAQSEETA